MDSMLRRLKTDIGEYKSGDIVELFITVDKQDNDSRKDKLHIIIKGLAQASLSENIEINQSCFDNYFEQEYGLDKVYSEYRAKVGSDLLKYNSESAKSLIKYTTITLIISLVTICLAVILGGTLGIIIASVSAIYVATFLVLMYRKSKKYKELNDNSIDDCRNTRKNELLHMLINLGYMKQNKVEH